MSKARDIADFKLENITDTGTEGTKVASGTTAQRGSTAGQLRFNSTTGLAEYYTGSDFKSIDTPPTISSLDVTEVDSNAGGNQTIVITGGNFGSGATVTFVGSSGTNFNASTVTVDSSTQITAVAPKSSFLNAQEPYGVKVINVSGLAATLAEQINVDSAPTWTTASGSLGTVYEGESVSVSATASDADGDTITYSETTSVLSGAGLSLNSSTGAITGTAASVSSDTTYNFTLRATANSKTSDRSFSLVNKNETLTATLPKQTIGWFKFENNLNDSSGANRNGSSNGTISYSSTGAKSSGFGTYGVFSGSNTVSLPYGSGSNETFACWYYSTSSSSTQHFLGDVGGAYNIAFTIQIINSTTVRIVVDGSGGPTYNNDFSVSSGTAFGDSTWHHLVCYKSGSTVGAYIDGVSLGTASATTRSGVNNYTLGGYTSSGGQFQGRLEDVRTWNSTLTSSEISTLYTTTNAR